MSLQQYNDKNDKLPVELTGAVYTPIEMAKELACYVSKYFHNKNIRILEPSVGDGVFLDQLYQNFNFDTVVSVDNNEEVVNDLTSSIKYNPEKFSFFCEDFIKYAIDYIKDGSADFDLVIGNPPFIRKHNFTKDFSENLKFLSKFIGYPEKYLKNSWVAFLVASSKICAVDGVVAFVLPYELMTVEYGQFALDFLSKEFQRIEIFISKRKAFPAIDQDAVIFIGKKGTSYPQGCYINHVDNMYNLRSPRTYKIDLHNPNYRSVELNSFLLSEEAVNLLKNIRDKCAVIEDYATSAPGIVSAANDFFILTKSDVEKLGVSDFVIPILKKGSFVNHSSIFSEKDFSNIEKNEACYLLNIQGNFDSLGSNLKGYIQSGEERGFHLRYKCRHRKNWYEVPIVPVEVGFFFKRSHSYPKIIKNTAKVYITDTAYGVRVKAGFSISGICYSFYNSLTLLFAEIEGRFYGGGVLELSPKEFRRLPIVYHEPTEKELAAFEHLHHEADGNVEKILNFGDRWLSKKLGLNPHEMAIIREAWFLIRSHRMRHSGRKDNMIINGNL